MNKVTEVLGHAINAGVFYDYSALEKPDDGIPRAPTRQFALDILPDRRLEALSTVCSKERTRPPPSDQAKAGVNAQPPGILPEKENEMRYLKMLGLAAVAAAALMAFVGAGTASASGVLCSTTSTPCNSRWATNTVMDFSLKSGTAAVLTNEENGEVLDECTGSGTTVKGTLNSNTSGGEATGTNSELLWKTCTFPTTTVAGFAGKLKVNNIAGTSNGTVTADAEARVTINTIFFGSCVYGVKNGAHLGVITEGKGTGAEFRAESAPAEKLEGSNFACPAKSTWTASYVLTSPSETTLSVSSS